ncbi:MAG: FRG domain-containing protein [Sneathiella sp.]|nr:FRG domain-containing protein [Sneathiella sp.]
MKGQWIGTYQGDGSSQIIVNIDEVQNHYDIEVNIAPNKKDFPATIAFMLTENISEQHELDAEVYAVEPGTGNPCNWDDIKDLYPNLEFYPDKAKVKLKLDDGKLTIDAILGTNDEFRCELKKRPDESESAIDGEKISWSDFRTYLNKLPDSNHLFRGQQKPWRLRTSFHRRGRYQIRKFLNKDVIELHQRLSAITSHYFDIDIPNQRGSFLNLLQHHGYPTPLLDWSYSPYVSAFFAFRDWPIGYRGNGDVRIYIFDNEAWEKDYPQISNLNPTFPHLSIAKFIAVGNTRLVPQQSATTITNLDDILDDIEEYVLLREQEKNSKYLRAIDISASEREAAMKDLRFMGITAGSMFPSLDGVCEELRERNFES